MIPTTINGVSVKIAKFRGRIDSLKGGNLLYSTPTGMKTTKISELDGSFEVMIPVSGKDQIITIRAIDDYGKTYDDRVKIKSEIDYTQMVRKLNYDLGASLSYFDYTESYRNVTASVTELGLTVKGGLNYVLNNHFELGGNTFFTAVPIALSLEQSTRSTTTGVVTTNSNTLQPARWYGFNARLGYRLPVRLRKGSLHLMTGWYIWGMNVPATTVTNSYGVKVLGGPQFFLTGRFRTSRGRAMASYLKFATIQDTTGFFSTTNREIAVGGAFQISKPAEGSKRWMGTLDVAQAKFSNAAGFNFTFNTVNLGISRSF
jgi:hypothetical protein